MMKSVHLATLLIVALLTACAGYAMHDTTLAACCVASSDTMAVQPLRADFLSPFSAGVRAVAPTHPPAVIEKAAANPAGRAYLFRGVLGLFFSRGMDDLTERLNAAGVPASINDYLLCPVIAKEAISSYRAEPAPLIIIGHSAGGICGLMLAETLADENIPVSLLATIDPTRFDPIQIAHNVPHNVERYINVYQSNSILGGGDVLPGQGFQGHYASFNLSQHDEITHVNIDKNESIHQQLVAKILQLAATPAKAEGEAVPIRCKVPAAAAIELWDSGTPVFAVAGDTLRTLAATYRVPLWSLTQINHMAGDEPLAAGQRIVVPRHLLPMTSDAAPSLRQAPWPR